VTASEIVTLELRFVSTPYQHLRVRDRRAERVLLASIEEHGQQFPITVIPADVPPCTRQ
jgi:ParB-like chromosome segregation protein Spo0J